MAGESISQRGSEKDREIAHSVRSEELAAQRTALFGRLLSLMIVAPLVTFLAPWPGPVFVYVVLVGFALLGWGAWLVANAKWGRMWHQYAFVTADCALLTFVLLYPNPMVPLEFPPQFALRFGSFIFFFILLSGLAYVYQPKLVLWGGISAAICWSIGVLLLLRLPDSVWAQSDGSTFEAILENFSLPTYVDLGIRVQEIVVLLIVAFLLALSVRRARQVALRQASLAREKENLGRYFPRKTAQLLADRSDPFSKPSEHDAAVLFADLVAFTNWSQKHTPQQTITMLRHIHGLLTDVVFRHDGTLDKFIGDGLMATFGTPEPTNSDASDALAAMVEMAEAFDDWTRNQENGVELRLSIGVHYGPVVIGNIGTKDRLEFAVLGDTVNIASRLENATREVGCRCLASAAIVAAAMAENRPEVERDLAKLERHGSIQLRGRSGEIDVYRM